MSELIIILVNYRRADDTIACIRSLRQSTYTSFDIVVVDNGSGDGSADRIRTANPGIRLIENTQNLGFAEGNNTALKIALHEKYAFALLLNNDTVVEPQTLAELIAAMRAHPDVGIMGAKIYFFDNPRMLWFTGGILNVHSGAVTHRGIHETDEGQYDQPGPCDFVTGCCLLIRRAVLERVGMLDTDYFAYYEDGDFSQRARRAGFGVFYMPTARVWHKISRSTQWDSPFYLYFTLRNRLVFLRKHSTLIATLPYIPVLLYFYGRQFIRLLFKRRSFAGVRAAWLAVIDGLRGDTGLLGMGSMDRLVPLRPHTLPDAINRNGKN